jgi:hypothetical protein
MLLATDACGIDAKKQHGESPAQKVVKHAEVLKLLYTNEAGISRARFRRSK